ncbi:MAG: hypothetical protein D6674_04350 [Acidobacteria bacterium]|jgi:cell division septal protein FtsQ|nr:MAG: hypothetical protein D6674_04350 [Acidobacteriota bacterium]
MGGKNKKKKGRFVEYALAILWLFSAGLGGFFVPHFTDSIPFFKVKRVYVEGTETIPPALIAEEISRLKNNWIFINSGILFSNINKKTGNAVKNVKLERIFTREGVELRVKIEERKPFVTVIRDGDVIFFDRDGFSFQSPYTDQTEPLFYTHDLELIKENFDSVKYIMEVIGRVEHISEAYVTNINTLIYTKEGLKIVLPSLVSLEKEDVNRILKVYNIGMGVREIDLSNHGFAIIRGGDMK